jgi:hypothetical protein
MTNYRRNRVRGEMMGFATAQPILRAAGSDGIVFQGNFPVAITAFAQQFLCSSDFFSHSLVCS